MRRSELLFDQGNRPTPAFGLFLKAIQIPGDDLLTINEALQRRFVQTDPVTKQPLERWEYEEVETHCSRDQIMRHLAECGFLRKTNPQTTRYKYAAWPGALVGRAAVRLQDLVGAWIGGVGWQSAIVFGGKRALLGDKESYVECCKAVGVLPQHSRAQEQWAAINPQTELEMMQWVWHVLYRPQALADVDIVFVDAPMKPPVKEGGLPVRPNTEDTVTEWLKSNPEPGSILLSSGAPYGMAQDETFRRLLEPRGFVIDTFGHAAPDDLPLQNFLREVAGAVFQIKKSRTSL